MPQEHFPLPFIHFCSLHHFPITRWGWWWDKNTFQLQQKKRAPQKGLEFDMNLWLLYKRNWTKREKKNFLWLSSFLSYFYSTFSKDFLVDCNQYGRGESERNGYLLHFFRLGSFWSDLFSFYGLDWKFLGHILKLEKIFWILQSSLCWNCHRSRSLFRWLISEKFNGWKLFDSFWL